MMRHRIYSHAYAHKKKQRRLTLLLGIGLLLMVGVVLWLLLRPAAPAPAAADTPMPVRTATPAATPLPQTPLPTSIPKTPAPGQSPLDMGDTPRTLYEAAVSLNGDDRLFYCTMRVTFTNNTPNELFELYFRLYPNAFQGEQSVNGAPTSYYTADLATGGLAIGAVSVNDKLVEHRMEQNGMLLQIPLKKGLAPGGRCTALLDFTLRVPYREDRFGQTDIGYQLGNFLPVLAVYEDGAWDTRENVAWGDPFYSEAADYKVAVSYPAAYDSFACTGEIQEQIESDQGKRVTTYATASSVRSFAAVLGHKLKRATIPAEEGLPKIVSWALTREKAERAAEYAKTALSVYIPLLGPYPYSTFTVAQTEINGEGMEYPGLVMIHKDLYLSGRTTELELTIAHEAAHQWFYGVVGSDELGAPWLDEALSNYLGFVYFEKIYDEERFLKLLSRNISETAGRAYPIDGALGAYPNNAAYIEAVYIRGAALFHALRERIGEEAFFAALRAYYRDNAFAVADGEALITAFEAASGEELSPWFSERLAPLGNPEAEWEAAKNSPGVFGATGLN